jgi:hypothetical protein
MPKFNKDQIQKMVLSAILLIFLVYAYFEFLMGPLSREDAANKKAIAEFQTKIEEARKQIKLGKNASERAVSSVSTMNTIESMIPKESAIAWFPPLVNQFFAKRGIPKVSLQLRTTEVVPGEGLDRFKYFMWDANFAPASAVTVISAISEFENEMPLLAIRSIKIDTTTGTPEEQRVICEFRTLLK